MTEVGLMDNRQSELRATSVAIVLLAVFFVVLRFISRRMNGIGIGSDDIMIYIALFFLFVAFATCMIGLHFGLGRHTAALSASEIISYAKSLIAFECLYVTCVCFTKLSLLLMYRRIFPVRSIKIGSLILGGLSVAWCISIIMVSVFQCIPMQKIWNPTLEGHCINLKASFIGNAIPNILTDVAILALPMQQVWGLHTSVMQKTHISFVFLLGSFVIFTSIYRFTTLFQFQPADITWTLATAEVWCVVESASGIMSACLPTLGPLVQFSSRKLGITSVLTRSSQARTSSAGPHLQTIGGSGGPKKSINISGKFDSSKNIREGSRPFRRLSAVSGISDERGNWKGGSNVRATVRAHDVESAKSVESDEIPLHNIVVNTEIEWTESGSGKTSKNSDKRDVY
ncbi:hypothetical protein BCIN_03g09320 [Botrytis cinerea B05.10]|uniref:Rhodopsin domain-containing protein n=1 Tax=Botryotinia fuckeliana (strain B05.10) TaxID=332648 RepID=A0A384JDS0_BOTFB|nr:hypothetical protein BCIN_03g09320 [Botrytis cinerea B05.10]ATZ48765.1 hypothetical protein BCIN_03g09320 [Botrytis cinerea B05.10]